MTAPEFFFFVFATIVVASALMVVSARNPVHSVLFLILAFFNSAGLFLLAGAEFLALLMVIVYVGAVAVLFLFVVMMLNVNFAKLREGRKKAGRVGAIVGAVLLAELVMMYSGLDFTALSMAAAPVVSNMSNTHALGLVLYTDYVYLFQVAGLILLLAMMSAIVLTLRQRDGVKKQSISTQVGRKKRETIELVDVEVGKGI